MGVMRKNKLSRSIVSMLFVNFNTWMRSSRTVVMLLFMLASTYREVSSYVTIFSRYQYTMNYSESMAYFFASGFGSISLASLTFLVLIAELPRRIPFQQYSLIRSNRLRWIAVQILYCVLLVLTMMVIQFLLTSVFVLPHMSAGEKWSDTLRIAEGADPEFAMIPNWIRAAYTPWQAFAVALVPIFFFWMVMALTILLFSLLGKPTAGITLFAVILFSSLIFTFELIPEFEPPTKFFTLMKIGYQYEEQYSQRLLRVFAGYGVIIVGLVTVIILVARKMDMPTYSLTKE